MKTIITFCFIFTITLSISQAQKYTVTLLVHPDGDFVASSINDLGQISGHVRVGFRTHAQRLEPDGTFTPLEELNLNLSTASGMNEHGDVIGTNLDDDGLHMVVWLNDGGTRELAMPPGARVINLEDINNLGEVVGFYFPETFLRKAAFWDTEGKFHDLPQSEMGATANAINDSSQIVGTSFDSLDRGYPVMWQPLNETSPKTLSNNEFDIVNFLGQTLGSATDINNKIQVTGWANTITGTHAFLWEDEVITDLGTLGGSVSFGLAINEEGVVVGSSSLNFIDFEDSGFLASPPDYKMEDINTFSNLPLLDTIVECQDVNTNRSILGYGKEGKLHYRIDKDPTFDIGLSPIEVSNGMLRPGENTITFTVKNNSEVRVDNIRVILSLPSGMSYVSHEANITSEYNSDDRIWMIPQLLDREDASLTLNVVVQHTAGEPTGTGAYIDNFIKSGDGGLNEPFGPVFGPDVNEDGIQDLYIVSHFTRQVLLYDGVTGNFLRPFVTSQTFDSLSLILPTYGSYSPIDLDFGPDINNDGIPECYIATLKELGETNIEAPPKSGKLH